MKVCFLIVTRQHHGMRMCTNVMKFRPDPCHVYLAPVVVPVKLGLSQRKHNTATTPTHTIADKRQQFSCDHRHDQHSLLHRLLQERLQLRLRAGAAGGRGGGPGAADHPRPPAPGCGPWHHRQTCQPCVTMIAVQYSKRMLSLMKKVRFHTSCLNLKDLQKSLLFVGFKDLF